MARALQRESMGKDTNGRYSEAFKNDVRKCIAKGLNSVQAAKELGVEPLGSGYRQLYYKLAREYKEGKFLPTMKVKGVAKAESSTGIKSSGADTSDLKNKKPKTPITPNKTPYSVQSSMIERKPTATPNPNTFKQGVSYENAVKETTKPVIKESVKPVVEEVIESKQPEKVVESKQPEKATPEVKSLPKVNMIESFAKEFENYSNADNVTMLEAKISAKISSLETSISLKQQEIDEMCEMIKFLEYIKWECTRG